MEAMKEDVSVQRWILGKLDLRRVVEERDTTGRARGKRALRAVEADAPDSVQVSNPAPPTIPLSQKVMSAYVSAPVDKQTEGWVKVIRGEPGESLSARHKCAICHLSFPESEMTYHAKTLRWACNECVEKQG